MNMAKRGRPKKFTPDLKKKIIARMAEGALLVEVCREIECTPQGVWKERQADIEFDRLFELACKNGILVYLDEARENLTNAETRDDVLKFKELLRHAEWQAEKRLIMFQPTVKSELKVDGPMVVGWQVEAPTVLNGEFVEVRARQLSDNTQLSIDR